MRVIYIMTDNEKLAEFLKGNFFAKTVVAFFSPPDEENTLIGDFVRENKLKKDIDYLLVEGECLD